MLLGRLLVLTTQAVGFYERKKEKNTFRLLKQHIIIIGAGEMYAPPSTFGRALDRWYG